MNATTTAPEKKGDLCRAYRLPIQDQDDLRMLIAHLPGFIDTEDANGRKVVVEVWYVQYFEQPTS